MAKKSKPEKPDLPPPPRPKVCDILPDTTLGDDVALVAENMEAILSSPSYSLAQEDRALLESPEMRGVRMLLELGKPELALQADNIESTVIVFGGTQIVERTAAERRLSEARRALQAAPADAKLKRDVERITRLIEFSRYYDDAREFARIVSIDNQCEDQRDYVVVTGGGPGIMEAANRGASEAGAPTIGLNIRLPHEQVPNAWVTPGLAFRFHYFAMRKMHFLLRARALVVFPGGFGTLDEVYEALNLVITRSISPMPIVLVGRDYWSRMLDLGYLVAQGVIDAEDADLVHWSDSGAEAAAFVLARCGCDASPSR